MTAVYFSFRPLSSWQGGYTANRQRASFRAGYSETLGLLRHELGMLDVRGAVAIEVDLAEEQIRRDGLPRAHAKPGIPAVALSFTGRFGPMRIATDRFDSWTANLRAIALGLESLRRVDRYGISRSGEQYRGWRQLEAGTNGNRGQELIREHRGFREALKATHPDVGGDPDDFRAVMATRDEGAA